MKAIKRLVEADALKMEIIPNPKVLCFFGYIAINCLTLTCQKVADKVILFRKWMV